jgi:rod shape-determining protein MreD
VFLAIAVALVLQTTLARFLTGGGIAVNLVLVAVVYAALAWGPVTGLLAGTAGGLAQDALSGAIIGIGGLAKTLVGFVVGVIGAQFIVAQPLPRFVVFVSATIVHEAVFLAVHALMPETRGGETQYGRILTQAVTNGLVGVLIFQAVELLPGALQRRQDRRAAAFRRRRL